MSSMILFHDFMILFAVHVDQSLNTSFEKIKCSFYICELVFLFSLCSISSSNAQKKQKKSEEASREKIKCR